MKKIILADADDRFREGLKCLIQDKLKQVEIIGSVSKCNELCDLVKSVAEPIIILDIYLPGEFEKTVALINNMPGAYLLALSDFKSDVNYITLVRSGIKSFISKSSGFIELENALSEVTHKGNYLSLPVMKMMTSNPSDNKEHLSLFTIREIEVLRKQTAGLSEEEIAKSLKLSNSALSSLFAGIQKKSGCNNKASLSLFSVMHEIAEL